MNLSSHFPMPEGKIYFDSAASSITALPVIEKMQEFYTSYRANIHRGEHSLTKKASEEYESVYEKLAKFFHADSQEFINVRNATEAINGVSLGLDWKVDDEIITTDVEHHSNLLPWLRLKERGVKLKILESDIDGMVNEENLKSLLSKKTKLVSFSACSNVVAGKVPIISLTKIAKDNGSLVLVDAAQYVGHHPIDLKAILIDYLAFSGHKCFGPTGVGVLFHRNTAPLKPWFLGGGTIRNASLNSFELLNHRERFEAGTPPIAEWIGLGAAIDFISKIGYETIQTHEQKLIRLMIEILNKNQKITLYGPKNENQKSSALFSFNLRKTSHHQTALMLNELGFALRSGHHCAMPLTKKLGVEGTARASLHIYNTEEEIKKFEAALDKISLLVD